MNLAFTLQMGREAMTSRAALVVNSIDELKQGLTYLRNHEQRTLPCKIPIYVSNPDEVDNLLQTLLSGGADTMVLQLFLEQRNYEKLAEFWVKGGKVPWAALWKEKRVQRISLPTYPFEKRYFWNVANGANLDETKSNASTTQAKSDTNDGTATNTLSVKAIVTTIVAESIGLTEREISPHLSLWQLGVDSIRGTEIAWSIRKRLHVEIGHRELAEYETLDALSQLVQQKREEIGLDALTSETESVSDPQKSSKVRTSAFPLSEGQRGLWLLHQLDPKMSAYNVPITLQFERSIDVDAIKQAASFLLDRHPILRAKFQTDDKGQPIQSLRIQNEFFFEYDEQILATEEALQNRLRRTANRVFDLDLDPLVRLHLFRQSRHSHKLLIVIHHLVVDGSSLVILLHHFLHAYAAFSRGNEPTIMLTESASYEDFVSWEQALIDSERGKASLAYWKKQLSGNLPLLALPFKRDRPPNQTFVGATVFTKLESTTTHQLRFLAKNQDISLFVLLLSIYQVLLARYTLQNDIIVGVPSAGRSEERFANTVGYFVNMVPVRTQIDMDESFVNLLKHLKIAVADGLDHSYFPFPKLVCELRIPRDVGHSPVFQTSFVMQSFWRPEVEQTLQDRLDGISISPGPNPEGEIELRLEIIEQLNEISVNFAYNTNLLDQATIAGLAQHFGNLVKSVCHNPKRPIHSLEFLSDDERQKLLNQDSIGSHHKLIADRHKASHDLQTCVHHLFEAQMEKIPEAVALIHNSQSLTYWELNQQASGLADYLREMGIVPGAIVGIFVERSISQIVAVLAVLKVGAAYLPLDPAYPQQRLAFMIEDADPSAILTLEKLRSQLIELYRLEKHGPPIVLIEQGKLFAPEEIKSSPLLPVNSRTYVIYTSGSTGHPKGVEMEHQSLMNLIRWQVSQAGEGQAPRTLQFASLNFDVSFQEIFSTLSSGGSLVLVDENMRSDPAQLVRLIEDSQIERLFLPYDALNSLAQQLCLSGGSLATLREVITAGEALRITPAISKMFRDAPSCVLHNQYGPSESHVVTYFTLEQNVDFWPVLPPIGRPIPGAAIYILDEHQNPVPIGVTGEIFIGGVGLARGYLNRSELTAEKFMTNPFGDGRLYKTGDLGRYLPDRNIEYLGRLDHQVKIRGFRIELGEIEVILSNHEHLQQCVVMAREDTPSNKRLVAYIVAKQKQPTISELRSFLLTKLPNYMIPNDFVYLDAMPLTPNGKIDRRALPNPEGIRPELDAAFVIPQTEMEKRIATIWQEILNLEEVGIHDNFFDLGGHSLLIIQVREKLQNFLHKELLVVEIFKHPTIHTLARYLQQFCQPQCSFSSVEESIDRVQIRKSRQALVKQKKQLRKKYH